MVDYLVTWRIDMEADSPDEAAARALIVQRDPESTAVVFEVSDTSSGTTWSIDLDDSEQEIYVIEWNPTGVFGRREVRAHSTKNCPQYEEEIAIARSDRAHFSWGTVDRHHLHDDSVVYCNCYLDADVRRER